MALAFGQTKDDAVTLNLAHLRHEGAKCGANEVHIHLLAENGDARALVEADLVGAHTPEAGGRQRGLATPGRWRSPPSSVSTPDKRPRRFVLVTDAMPSARSCARSCASASQVEM